MTLYFDFLQASEREWKTKLDPNGQWALSGCARRLGDRPRRQDSCPDEQPGLATAANNKNNHDASHLLLPLIEFGVTLPRSVLEKWMMPPASSRMVQGRGEGMGVLDNNTTTTVITIPTTTSLLDWLFERLVDENPWSLCMTETWLFTWMLQQPQQQHGVPPLLLWEDLSSISNPPPPIPPSPPVFSFLHSIQIDQIAHPPTASGSGSDGDDDDLNLCLCKSKQCHAGSFFCTERTAEAMLAAVL